MTVLTRDITARLIGKKLLAEPLQWCCPLIEADIGCPAGIAASPRLADDQDGGRPGIAATNDGARSSSVVTPQRRPGARPSRAEQLPPDQRVNIFRAVST